MEPSMNPVLNMTAFESQFENTRDAMLHITCTTLEYLGFKTSAWYSEVFSLLNDAFEACVDAQLQPRYVTVKLMKGIEEHNPGDNVPELLALIGDVIGSAEAHKASGAGIVMV